MGYGVSINYSSEYRLIRYLFVEFLVYFYLTGKIIEVDMYKLCYFALINNDYA